jgi:hypothetical protein
MGLVDAYLWLGGIDETEGTPACAVFCALVSVALVFLAA